MLVRFGYRHDEVAEMPLPKFLACSDAAEQISAAERAAFVVDMSAVVSGIFAKKGSNPVGKHLDLLGGVASGDSSGDQPE